MQSAPRHATPAVAGAPGPTNAAATWLLPRVYDSPRTGRGLRLLAVNLAAGTPLWPAEWTAIGTLALAAVTVAAITSTIIITKQDRKRADEQRREEREHSAAMLREERDHAEEVRRRERQADNARILLQRVVILQPYYDSIPGMSIGASMAGAPPPGRPEAIESLQHGALAEVPLLGGDDAAQTVAERYRQLVQLIYAVANDNGSDRGWLAATLKAYARWVRITLRMLAENQTVPPIHAGSPEIPLLGIPADMPFWQPNPIPPGWNEELDSETAR